MHPRHPILTDTLRGVSRVLSGAAARLDRGVLGMMERRMRATAPRRAEGFADARERLVDLASRYGDGTLTLPSRFFAAPSIAEVTETPVGVGPAGSRVTDLAFPSTYRPFLPDYLREHESYPENLIVRARAYAIGAGRPVAVLLHGWGGGAYWVEERAFAIGYWLRQGFDVVLFQLPFHGARSPAGTARGALFPSAHVVRTNEAFGQAVSDLRALRGHLARHGAAVGVMGMSLGGYTAAVWASIDDQLAFAVPIIPAVDMADLMWRHGEASPAHRRASRAGVTRDLLRDVFSVHAPLTRPARLPRERLMIVAGRGDRITPPDQAERLRRHWDDCAIHWFPGGHLAQVGRGEALREVRRRLDRLDLPGRPPRPALRSS